MDIMLEHILDCMGEAHGAAKELADALGINPQIITNWKCGQSRSYRKYYKQIAAYYDVNPDYLLGRTDEKSPAPGEVQNGEKKNVVRTIGRDGSYEERYLTDEQLEALKAVIRQMPKVEDDF